MIISELYKTQIDCNHYEAHIDSTDTVVTAKLLDFNNNPVTGKNVTLKCDKGHWSNNNTSFSGTTDSNGEISATYKAEDWGLVTFTCNEAKAHVNVYGWKDITPSGQESISININESMVQIYIAYPQIKNISGWKNLRRWSTTDLVPSKYRSIVLDNRSFPYIVRCQDWIDRYNGTYVRVTQAVNCGARGSNWADEDLVVEAYKDTKGGQVDPGNVYGKEVFILYPRQDLL